MTRDSVVRQLVGLGNWTRESAELAERADFRCEYCGLDLLETPDNYRQFQEDHIVPITCGGSQTDVNNLALVCRTCNWNWKPRWDPRTVAGQNASRDELIAAVRNYVRDQKFKTEQEMVRVRAIVGHASGR